jgi:hypothetical protein
LDYKPNGNKSNVHKRISSLIAEYVRMVDQHEHLAGAKESNLLPHTTSHMGNNLEGKDHIKFQPSRINLNLLDGEKQGRISNFKFLTAVGQHQLSLLA